MSTVSARPHRGVALPIAFAGLAVMLFLALGTWQLERRGEKLALIEKLDSRLAAAPLPLPARNLWPQLNAPQDDYRRVTFSAAFVPGADALVYAGPSPFPSDMPGAGYWVFALARRSNGDLLVIDRGYVPEEAKQDAKDAAARKAPGEAGSIEMAGVMRWPPPRSVFTPADDPAHNLWFVRDPRAIARGNDWGEVAPFYVELESPAPPGGLPRPAPARPNLRNAHLQYAITWYGLAAVTIVMLAFWLRAQRREGARPP